MTGEILLQARAVTKRYGSFTAVNDVNLDIRAGSVHSVIGPNGAGKTTLFHVLTGAVPITAGTVHVDGRDISRLPGHKRVRRGLGRSFQVTSLFQNLAVKENLRVAAQGRAPWDVMQIWPRRGGNDETTEIVEELLERFGLDPVMDRPAGALSHGQQRRLEVAMAMAARPRLIFLDEPTSGMGIDDIEEMKQLIVALRDEGYAVVLVEHNMDIVMGVSDVITVMQSGRVLVEGKPDVIRNDPRVRVAYLGNMLTGGR
jgi:branched-chain amino acid transport system ATP-binding protein